MKLLKRAAMAAGYFWLMQTARSDPSQTPHTTYSLDDIGINTITGFSNGPHFTNYEIPPFQGDGQIVFSQPHETVNNVANAGATYILNEPLPSDIDVMSLASLDHSKVTGTAPDERSGLSVATVENFRGDGVSAVAICNNGTAIRLVFPKQTPPNEISLVADATFWLQFVTNIGDINNDGNTDLFAGGFDLLSESNRVGFILFGTILVEFGQVINLFDQNYGIKLIRNSDPVENLVIRAIRLLDFNGDGYDDVPFFPHSNVALDPKLLNTGYILYGGKNLPTEIVLDDLDGSDGFRLTAAVAFAFNGWHMATAVFTASGLSDLLIASENREFYYGQPGVSEAVVVYGGNNVAVDGVFSLETMSNVFRIIPPVTINWSISSVSGGFDFNGDGSGDFVLGIHYSDPTSTFNILSESIIIFGGTGEPSIDLARLDGSNGVTLTDGLITAYHGNIVASMSNNRAMIATHGITLFPFSANGKVTIIRSLCSPSLSPTTSNTPSPSPTTTPSSPNDKPCMPLRALHGVNYSGEYGPVCLDHVISKTSKKTNRCLKSIRCIFSTQTSHQQYC